VDLAAAQAVLSSATAGYGGCPEFPTRRACVANMESAELLRRPWHRQLQPARRPRPRHHHPTFNARASMAPPTRLALAASSSGVSAASTTAATARRSTLGTSRRAPWMRAWTRAPRGATAPVRAGASWTATLAGCTRAG
jgi:hypothetical protein